MRRKTSRFPYSLLPAVLLILGAGMFLSRGCRPGRGINRDLSESESRSDQSAEYITQAITAIGTGDNRNAQKFLLSAVDERAQASTLGEAFASVAKELVQKGHATEAVNLLEPASRDARISWSPLIWAALGQACGSAGDSARSTAATAKADAVAREIMNAAPPTTTAAPELRATSADRYIQLAAYQIDVKGKPEAAIVPYRTALSLMPDNPRIMNNLGDLLAETGPSQLEFDEAVKLTKAAVATAPEDGEFLDSYGWALFKTRDFTGALHVLTEAVAYVPEAPEIHLHLAKLYAEMSQPENASLEFSRALRLRPDYPEAVQSKRLLEQDAQPALQPSASPSSRPAPAR